jgi:hypothetical protein
LQASDLGDGTDEKACYIMMSSPALLFNAHRALYECPDGAVCPPFTVTRLLVPEGAPEGSPPVLTHIPGPPLVRRPELDIDEAERVFLRAGPSEYWRVLLMDATYKLISLKWPVFVLGTVDAKRSFHPIAFCFSNRENTEAFSTIHKL